MHGYYARKHRRAPLVDQLLLWFTSKFYHFFLTQILNIVPNFMSLGLFNQLWSLLLFYKECAHTHTEIAALCMLIQHASNFCHFFLSPLCICKSICKCLLLFVCLLLTVGFYFQILTYFRISSKKKDTQKVLKILLSYQ